MNGLWKVSAASEILRGGYFSSHPMELIAYEKLVGKSQGAAGTLRKLGRQVRFMHDRLDT